ncbi:bacterio-opsin activator domain-containing protein [Haloarchaeobius sp. DT45]|uniref:bacterio-opsin activator domain-containing protein n=1 Tax=Haloarchaeobius sp. DT45 TaxID=3446116 RepID=UPI003F6A6D5F
MRLVDVTVEATDFPLGALTAQTPAAAVELVRVVPVDGLVAPLLWVVGDDLEGFERAALSLEQVQRLSLVDASPGRRLYRFWWRPEATPLVSAIHACGGTILDGRGTDEWHFFVRFPDAERRDTFFRACATAGIPFVAREYSSVA